MRKKVGFLLIDVLTIIITAVPFTAITVATIFAAKFLWDIHPCAFFLTFVFVFSFIAEAIEGSFYFFYEILRDIVYERTRYVLPSPLKPPGL